MKYRIILFLNLEIVESLISFLPNKLKSYCGNYLRAYGNLGFVQKLLQNTFHIQEHVAIAQVLQRRAPERALLYGFKNCREALLSLFAPSVPAALYYNTKTDGGQKYHYCKIEPPQSISSFLTEDLTSISALSLSLLCIITKEMPGVLVWYGVQHLLKEIRDKSGKKCVNLIET